MSNLAKAIYFTFINSMNNNNNYHRGFIKNSKRSEKNNPHNK